MSVQLTASFVRHLKKQAKALMAERGLSRMAALHELAREAGYQDWTLLDQAHKAAGANTGLPVPRHERSRERRRRVSHRWLRDNHMTFVPIWREFADDALSPSGFVWIVGSPRLVPLYFVVEWDSRRVLVGYAWEIGSYHRRMTGREEWLSLASAIRPKNADDIDPREWEMDTETATQFALSIGRRAQEVLDDAPEDEPLGSETKEAVMKLLGPRDM